jgi:imidazole glycerol-phosphate synthase subunit HisH
MRSNGVAIINSGGANIASLRFALGRLNVDAILTTDISAIRNATHVILPGVGAAADAMQRLKALGIAELIPTLEQPVLGICLGMQLLADASEEDDSNCLGIFPGVAGKLAASPELPVPHMGWSRIAVTREHPLLASIPNGSYFYFLHSYALPVAGYTLATARHATDFTAIMAQRNFYAAQFHPERSSAAGARLLANFLGLAS